MALAALIQRRGVGRTTLLVTLGIFGAGLFFGDGMITPEQVATEIADAAEKPELPLRIPIGDPARAVLAARHAAPDDVPFA